MEIFFEMVKGFQVWIIFTKTHLRCLRRYWIRLYICLFFTFSLVLSLEIALYFSLRSVFTMLSLKMYLWPSTEIQNCFFYYRHCKSHYWKFGYAKHLGKKVRIIRKNFAYWYKTIWHVVDIIFWKTTPVSLGVTSLILE